MISRGFGVSISNRIYKLPQTTRNYSNQSEGIQEHACVYCAVTSKYRCTPWQAQQEI
jgi:hypothetical protein